MIKEFETSVEMPVNNDNERARGSKSSKKRQRSFKSKYTLLKPCSCKKAFLNRINAERRLAIHQQYWNMSYDEQQHHLYQGISCKQIARHRSRNKDSPKMKSMSRQY